MILLSKNNLTTLSMYNPTCQVNLMCWIRKTGKSLRISGVNCDVWETGPELFQRRKLQWSVPTKSEPGKENTELVTHSRAPKTH